MRLSRVVVAAIGTGLVAMLLGWAGPTARAGRASAPLIDLTLGGVARPVPPSFLGISFEYDQLAKFESAGRPFDRMIAVMHSHDGAPMFVRLGGRSADDFYWDPPTGTVVPRFVHVLSPPWLATLGDLVRRDDLRIGFDLNLAVHSPQMEMSFVRAALRALPQKSVASAAFGNEPDLYWLQPWLDRERVSSTMPSTPAHWVESYSRKAERRYYRQYAQPFRRAFPHVPLEAPDLAFPNPTWVAQLTSLGRLAPPVISVHRYATAYCRRIHFHGAPKVSTFLKNGTSAGLVGTLHHDLALAQAHGAALRVSEMNSVTCGGEEGVADSFATALWAPDVLFELMRAGVVGANFHIRPRLPNAPFHIVAGQVQAEPEVYGLALFARMIGPGASLLALRLPHLPGYPLKAWGVSSRDGVRLLLINKSSHGMTVRFTLPGRRRAATVLRLLAPSPRATAGVTLGGQSIGPDGRWQGQRVVQSLLPAAGTYRLALPAYSAALVHL
jgi:hypothetical protein